MIPNPISVKSEDAEWIASLLIEHGWKQTSRRWRILSRLPDGQTGIDALVDARAALHHRLGGIETLTEAQAAAHFCREYAEAAGLTIVLPRHVFDAFRKLGGKAW